MSYDNDFDTDSDSYYSDENNFYTGYTSPADEWQVTRQTLFKEFQGSVFTANDKISRRLARLNEVIAFAESKDTKKINKKNYILDNYSFLQEFIPENIFEKITEIMAFTNKEKKKIARDIRLNVETLATILSIWQLELYSTGNYVTEATLGEINEFLKGSSSYGEFRKKGHVTSKDIERCESRILRQLYNETIDDKKSSNDNELPGRVLEYYRSFMLNLDQYLNENQRKLQEKNPILPFHVYLMNQKKELLKRILPKIALDYFKFYIELKDQEVLGTIIEEFYNDKNAMIGELVAQAIVLIERYFNKVASIDHMPKKFRTRVKKYRNEFANEFDFVIEGEQKSSLSIESDGIDSEHDNELVIEINEQINRLTNLDTEELKIDLLRMNQKGVLNEQIEFQKTKFKVTNEKLNFRQKSFLRQLGISEEFYSTLAISVLNNDKTLLQLAIYKLLLNIAFLIIITIHNKLNNLWKYETHFAPIKDNFGDTKTNYFPLSIIQSIFFLITKNYSINGLIFQDQFLIEE